MAQKSQVLHRYCIPLHTFISDIWLFWCLPTQLMHSGQRLRKTSVNYSSGLLHIALDYNHDECMRIGGNRAPTWWLSHHQPGYSDSGGATLQYLPRLKEVKLKWNTTVRRAIIYIKNPQHLNSQNILGQYEERLLLRFTATCTSTHAHNTHTYTHQTDPKIYRRNTVLIYCRLHYYKTARLYAWSWELYE